MSTMNAVQLADLHAHPPLPPEIHHYVDLFAYGHLPPRLQEISRPFCELAAVVMKRCAGREAEAALRRLLEAKDCAVRALVKAPATCLHCGGEAVYDQVANTHGFRHTEECSHRPQPSPAVVGGHMPPSGRFA